MRPQRHWRVQEFKNVISHRIQICVAVIGLLSAGLMCSTASTAMTLKQVEDQLILSGPVVDGDADKVQKTLAKNPLIKTVVLRNSPGGDVPDWLRYR
jgi:hypothetical protein